MRKQKGIALVAALGVIIVVLLWSAIRWQTAAA